MLDMCYTTEPYPQSLICSSSCVLMFSNQTFTSLVGDFSGDISSKTHFNIDNYWLILSDST